MKLKNLGTIPYDGYHKPDVREDIQNDITEWIAAQKTITDPPYEEICPLDAEIMPTLCQLLHSAEYKQKTHTTYGERITDDTDYGHSFYHSIKNGVPNSRMDEIFKEYIESKIGKIHNIVFLYLKSGGYLKQHSDDTLKHHFVIPVSFTDKIFFCYKDYGPIKINNLTMYKLDILREHGVINYGPDRVMISILDYELKNTKLSDK